jgi:hypothetical protein
MGMCKRCSKVVSVFEMEDGYCKECRDPKKQEEKTIAAEKKIL